MFKRQLVNNVRLYDSKNGIKGAAFSVDVQVDRFGKIKAEDTHDRFCIDHISSGYKVEITVKFADFINKSFNFINGIQWDF